MIELRNAKSQNNEMWTWNLLRSIGHSAKSVRIPKSATSCKMYFLWFISVHKVQSCGSGSNIDLCKNIQKNRKKKTQNHEAKIEGCLMCTRTKVKNIQPLGTRVKVKLWKKYGKMPRNVVYNTAASTSIL